MAPISAQEQDIRIKQWLAASFNLDQSVAMNLSYISLAPPQSIEGNRAQVALASIYMLLCVIGLFGNTGVTAIVGNILLNVRGTFTSRQMFIYLLGLSMTDAMCLLSIPMIVSYMLLNNWLFGTTMCKIYLGLETVTKLMSTFILTALSVDRYMAVCRPFNVGFRTTRTAFLVQICAFLLAVVLLIPLPMYAEVIRKPKSPVLVSQNGAVFFLFNQCQELMPPTLHSIFAMYTFCLGFVAPGCIISFCYFRILTRVRRHSKRMGAQSHIPLRRVTRYTLLVVAFYFLCLTPYWMLNVAYVLVDFSSMDESHALMKAFWAIHTLPYVNSAFNWVFYALLNSELRSTAADVVQFANSRGRFDYNECSEQQTNATLKHMRMRSMRSSSTHLPPTISLAQFPDDIPLTPLLKRKACSVVVTRSHNASMLQLMTGEKPESSQLVHLEHQESAKSVENGNELLQDTSPDLQPCCSDKIHISLDSD